jgi:hypothetical protein
MPQPPVKKKGVSLAQVGCLVLVVIVLIGVVTNQAGRSSSTPSAPAKDPKEAALSNVQILEFKGNKDGAFLKVTFKIRNSNTFPVKDLEVRCDHSGKSGTIMDHNTRTIYDVIPGNSTKTFPDFDMGFIHSQAVSTRCSVISLATP